MELNTAAASGWLTDLETAAGRSLPDFVAGYFAMTAGGGTTHREGLRDWSASRFVPRVLSGVGSPSTATTVLGTAVNTPVLLGPVAQATAAHPDGEVAVARAAARAGSLLGVSTHAGVPFADVAATGAPWWLQVYVMTDRDLTAALVRRAVAAGARALVLTVDLPTLDTRQAAFEPSGWPDRALAARGLNLDDLADPADPASKARRTTAPDVGLDTVGWLAGLSGLPVVVKGVLHPDDAVAAVGAGAAGVLVSTHGGRALDRSVTSRQALPAVVAALDGSGAQTFVDSGLRSGADVLTALALGARAVFVGRPQLWGLATGGADGVAGVVEGLTNELRRTMAMTGVAAATAVPPGVLAAGGWPGGPP
ncbi:alpha-hydroxy acid oxidase [Nakamurella deserti]|uniref:alpha-hydroxy acid oxidase n=1 Tax=Nakamurella deserti TaxID=2164074 RepID=UPI000DBE0244|nr:alpha-hydroxy acid oxidase [Nakamurella deserti]